MGVTHIVVATPCGGGFHAPLSLHGGTANTVSYGINVRNGGSVVLNKSYHATGLTHMGGLLGGGQRKRVEGKGEGGREVESFILAMTRVQWDMQWHMCKGTDTGHLRGDMSVAESRRAGRKDARLL